MEQNQPGDLEFPPSSYDFTPHLAASEVHEFVDSFINGDQEQKDDNQFQENHQDLEEMVRFSILNEDDFCDVPMLSTKVSLGVDPGLNLVHSLLACAEAVGCRDTQLANTLLAQIWASVNPWGDSLQRVSHCFAMGLKSRLLLLQNVYANGTFSIASKDVSSVSREQKIEAFHLLYQTTPYIAFGFMASNEAMCEASRGKDSLHVIDLSMEHTIQWSSLIRTLASRPEGPPRLRMTGPINGQDSFELEASMKALTEDANSLGISLEFNMISEPITLIVLTRENLKLREGKELLVNNVMHLHKFVKESRGSLKGILQVIKKLNPTLLTVVEQDANHNGPFFWRDFSSLSIIIQPFLTH